MNAGQPPGRRGIDNTYAGCNYPLDAACSQSCGSLAGHGSAMPPVDGPLVQVSDHTPLSGFDPLTAKTSSQFKFVCGLIISDVNIKSAASIVTATTMSQAQGMRDLYVKVK